MFGPDETLRTNPYFAPEPSAAKIERLITLRNTTTVDYRSCIRFEFPARARAAVDAACELGGGEL